MLHLPMSGGISPRMSVLPIWYLCSHARCPPYMPTCFSMFISTRRMRRAAVRAMFIYPHARARSCRSNALCSCVGIVFFPQERRRRKEKLEALQKKSLEAEKARKEAAAAAVASQTTKNGEAVAAADQSMPGNSDDTNDQEKSNNSGDVVAAAAAAGGDDSGDDDAGPIEIVKQGSDHAFLTANENDNDQRDDDDDDNEQEDLSGAVPGEGRSRKKIDGKQDAGRGALPSSEAGKSSSELRAHQGKEDRPVFDMFSAVSLKSDAVGPKIGGKGTGGNHMSYLGGDDGGDQVGDGLL